MDARESDAIVGDRPLLDTTSASVLPPAEPFSYPSDSSYSFNDPTALAFVGAPRCELLLVDASDMAVHVFRPNGKYVRSFGVPQEAEQYRSAYRIAGHENGMTVLSDDSEGWLAIARQPDTTWNLVRPPRLVQKSPPGSVVAIARGDRIIEHWFGAATTHRDPMWKQPLPLMRVFDMTGKQVSTLDSVRHFSGVTFTSALNHGAVIAKGDSVWFLNRASARLTKYLLTDSGSRAVDRIELPIAFRPSRPMEVPMKGRGSFQSAIQEEVSGIAFAANGDWLVGQTIGYQKVPGRGPLPRGMLTAYDRHGVPIHVYRTPGAIRSLTAGAGRVYAILLDYDTHKLKFRSFVDPTSRADSYRSNACKN